jgi:hypothetical protein
MPKATNTPSEYVMRIDFPTQQWLHENVSMLPVLLPMIQVRVILEGIKVACLMPVLCKRLDKGGLTRAARGSLKPRQFTACEPQH